jgi:hypothetical protein
MNHKNYAKIVMMITATLFMVTLFNSGAFSQNQENLITLPSLDYEEGHILYSPMYDTTTYLINETGVVNHTWHSSYTPTLESYMVDNGSIIRSIWSGRGGFQHIAWNDTLLWEYHYTRDSSYYSHDIVPLPNGDVIMLMQEIKSRASAIQAGRDPNNLGNDFLPDFLIQVHQTGLTSGDIVWEWHIWDHLIQDYDASKENYGNVSQHPELIDINFGEDFVGDWIHMNSVDYNPKFDQILMSAHNFDEVWIIDHSTTTEESAGHEGGQYGYGGDLLYRWGNPQAYDRGTAADEKLYFQHQVTWIKPGLPGAGNILVFSNGNTRPGGPHSSADEFTPDVNNDTGEYNLLSDGTYGPDNLTWHYLIPIEYYSGTLSGVQRMINGNTLICSGEIGTFLEVTPDKQIIWIFFNPYPNYQSPVYKTEYIPPLPPPQPPHLPDLECNGSLSWSNIKPGATVHGSFQVMNIGDNDSLLNWTVNNTPTWGTWTFSRTHGENLTPAQGPVTIHVYVVIPKEKNAGFQGNITIVNTDNHSDYCMIPVILTTPFSQNIQPHWFLARLLMRFPQAFPILRYLMGF